jgi:hypothetical protein
MKSLFIGLLQLTIILTVVACGKNNESGKKSSNWDFANPYGGQFPVVGNINSPYSYGGMSVNQVMQQNPCLSGWGGMPGYNNQQYAGQRIPIQIPLTNFPTVIAPGDIYVGVTSFGDVAVVAGQNVNQPPLFVGYMCPRSFTPTGQGQLMGITIGSYTNCLFKPITAATIVFPGGAEARFRWMDGPTSTGQKFTFCK